LQVHSKTSHSFSLARLAKYYSFGMLLNIITLLWIESGVNAHMTFSLKTFIIIVFLAPCYYFFNDLFRDFNEAGLRMKGFYFIVTMIGAVIGIFVCAFLFGLEAEILN